MGETEKPVSVSILICVRNTEKYIGNCINSLLKQTYTNFEIIIVEEFDSYDKTREIIEKFKDNKINYFRNEKQLGISRSRNRSVIYSRGEYLFFTDGDCVVGKNWLEEGVKLLKDKDCAGVEGKSYNVSEGYEPTFSDHTYEMPPMGFMTNNMAYKKSIVEDVGGFDERYTYHEDRDLALRILKIGGKIRFNPCMKVFIQQETLTPKGLLRRSEGLRNKVFLFKRFRQCPYIVWRIVDPLSLVKVLCPPLLFIGLLTNRFMKADDYRLLPFQYVNLFYSRVKLWRESAKERIFLI